MGDLQGKSDDQLQKVLENSQTLQPEFMKQKKVAPYHLTKYQKKKQRRVSGLLLMFILWVVSCQICVLFFFTCKEKNKKKR